MRSAAKRYAVAAIAFLAAAAWLGVALTSGFACLVVFVIALQIASAHQRRSGGGRQRTDAPGERPRRRPARSNERSALRPAEPARVRPARRIYDGGSTDLNWPVPSEATW